MKPEVLAEIKALEAKKHFKIPRYNVDQNK
jgi:hypothetical protein